MQRYSNINSAIWRKLPVATAIRHWRQMADLVFGRCLRGTRSDDEPAANLDRLEAGRT